MMMMMMAMTTKKKKNVKSFLCVCAERDFNEFANFVDGGNISNLLYGCALLPLGLLVAKFIHFHTK